MKYIKTYEENKYDYDEVKELIDDFIGDKYGAFFSFCNGHYYKQPGDLHVAELKKYLKRKGVNLDNFMKENWEEITDDDFFIAANGFMDYLLYTYDKTIPLSGGGEVFDSAEEISIKYEYGYQNYKLGQEYLKQSFGTLANFYIKHINYCLDDLNTKKADYLIDTYDDNNVFVFTCDKNYSPSELYTRFRGEELGESKANLIMIKLKKVVVFLFGDLNIKDEKELDEYYDMIADLELQSDANKYNM